MTNATEGVLTVREFSERVKVKPPLAYKLIATGQIRSVRVGRLIRIPESAVREFLGG